MQSFLAIYCFIMQVSLLLSALYAKRPYYLLLCMQSVLITYCFICKASLLFSALYAKCPYYVVLYMQSTRKRDGSGSKPALRGQNVLAEHCSHGPGWRHEVY